MKKAVEYKCSANGPLHQQLWTAIAYSESQVIIQYDMKLTVLGVVDGIEYGSGEGLLSKELAKEQAAKSAYLRYMKPH